jgi:hypothetical protein
LGNRTLDCRFVFRPRGGEAERWRVSRSSEACRKGRVVGAHTQDPNEGRAIPAIDEVIARASKQLERAGDVQRWLECDSPRHRWVN